MEKENNYPTWLVPVETAIRLKEIGFNEYCVHYTRVAKNADETLEKIISVCHDHYGRMTPGIRNSGHIDTETTIGVSIPTWEQVLEWFRGKNLIGTIEYEDFYPDDKTCDYAYCIMNKLGKVLFYSPNYNTYETYEEARKALINHLIRFYKTNMETLKENK